MNNCGEEVTALWLDALTVPIKIEYKRLAIQQLRRVYREAEAVLFLDRALQHVGSNSIYNLCSANGLHVCGRCKRETPV